VGCSYASAMVVCSVTMPWYDRGTIIYVDPDSDILSSNVGRECIKIRTKVLYDDGHLLQESMNCECIQDTVQHRRYVNDHRSIAMCTVVHFD